MGHIVFATGRDQGPLIGRVSLAMYTVAVAVVALRCFTRGCIVKKFGLDDLFIAIALGLGAAQTATIILQIGHGQGRHASELHIEQFDSMLMYQWINMLTYFVGNWAVKMSILALYYRIGHERQGLPWIVQARSVWTVAGFMTAFSLSTFLSQLFLCVPISRVWDIAHVDEGGCIDVAKFMTISGAINVVTDVMLLIFPLPLLRLMKFNRRQRTALALILSVGLIPVVASTIRLCEIVMAGRPISPGSSWQETDFSWGWAWVPVWSQIEVDVGILAASLPSLSPLLKQVFNCPGRASTPSQVSTLPGYRGSWGDKVLVSMDQEDSDMEKGSKHFDSDMDEKRLTVREMDMGKAMDMTLLGTPLGDKAMDMGTSSYDDSLSDADEGAHLADLQVVTLAKNGEPKVVEYQKL